MAGKIMLTLAMSIDGFIADENGGYSWISGQGDDRLDTDKEDRFAAFLRNIDIVVMGNRCYQEGFARDFTDKEIFVAVHAKQENYGNVTFIGGDIVERICKGRDSNKNIYLFGGGILIDPFIKADIIDEYHIGIVPVILGKGRPLFLEDNPRISLHLEDFSLKDGIFDIRYTKRAYGVSE